MQIILTIDEDLVPSAKELTVDMVKSVLRDALVDFLHRRNLPLICANEADDHTAVSAYIDRRYTRSVAGAKLRAAKHADVLCRMRAARVLRCIDVELAEQGGVRGALKGFI